MLTIENQADLDDLFADVVADFRTLRMQPFLDGAQRIVEDFHGTLFANQQSPAGSQWAALSPATIARKGHATILFETGRLKGSLTQPNHGDGIRSTWDEWPNNAGLIFGTDVPYSQFHLFGTQRLPVRDHLGLNEVTLNQLVDRAADHAVAELMP